MVQLAAMKLKKTLQLKAMVKQRGLIYNAKTSNTQVDPSGGTIMSNTFFVPQNGSGLPKLKDKTRKQKISIGRRAFWDSSADGINSGEKVHTAEMWSRN